MVKAWYWFSGERATTQIIAIWGEKYNHSWLKRYKEKRAERVNSSSWPVVLRWALKGTWESARWARTFQSEGKVIDVSRVPIRYLGILLKTSHGIIKTVLGGKYCHSPFQGWGNVKAFAPMRADSLRWKRDLNPMLSPLHQTASIG